MEQQGQGFDGNRRAATVENDRTATTKKFRIDMLQLFRVDVAGLSDIGRKRTNNEDSFGYDVDENLFVVCDGMGGMAAGEVASGTAVESMLRTYKERDREETQTEEWLRKSINSANMAVWNLAQKDHRLRGMGTTLVAACIRRTTLVVGNVGDSRAYLLRDGNCIQITEDHSFAAERKRMGGAGLSDHVAARLQQVITRAVGVGEAVQPDFFATQLQSGDTVLLTTDGLTRYADEEKIAMNIQQHDRLEDACRSLIAIAHAAGAEDNVTCLLLRVH